MGVDLQSMASNKLLIPLSREQRFLNRYNMYHGDYRDQALDRLRLIYSNMSTIGIDKQLDMTNNIFRAIIDKVSKVYTNGVVREIPDEELEGLYNELSVTKFMTQANRYLNAFNDLLIQVIWDSKRNRPKLIFRYPHNTRVTLDEFGEVASVEYYIASEGAGKSKWAYWSDTEHYYKIYSVKDGTFNQEPVEGNKKMKNPYGRLPFVILQKGFRDNNFFDEYSGTDLVETTLDNAIYNTFKNHLIKWQSFKQIVVTGQNISEIDGQILDPASAITVSGTDTNFQLLDLQANLDELSTVLDAQISRIAINYNISPSQFKMTSQVSTGFALKIENLQLDNITREDQKDFVLYEKELYNLLVTVSNTHGKKYSTNFSVAFNPISYQESDEIKLNAQARAIDLGLVNPIEIISKEKNLTLKDAEDVWKDNIEIRNKMLNKIEAITIGTNIDDGFDN